MNGLDVLSASTDLMKVTLDGGAASSAESRSSSMPQWSQGAAAGSRADQAVSSAAWPSAMVKRRS
jgi:hypothetical protein